MSKQNDTMDRALELVQRPQAQIPEALGLLARDSAGHAVASAALRIERAGGQRGARAAVVRMLCQWLEGDKPTAAGAGVG